MEGGDDREGRERGEALSIGRAGGRSLMNISENREGLHHHPQILGTEEV